MIDILIISEPTRKSFDLKASLARPLNYRPYTGKIKPYQKAPNSAA
jgi:hypothetical protein